MIVANKTDVSGMDRAKAIFAPYERAGYTVHYTAAKAGLIGMTRAAFLMLFRVNQS